MARRDRLTEYREIIERRGRRGGRFPSHYDIRQLKNLWAAHEAHDGATLIAGLIPARIVTFIEVFCRYWVQNLIDHGPPYADRAIDLKADVKYDHELVRSLQGKTISLGFLISHSISLSHVGPISGAFSILLGDLFFEWLSKVRDRYSMERDFDEGRPIIMDVDTLKRRLSRVFEVRHILVHEFPAKLPFDLAEIQGMLDAAVEFINAADEGFTQLLYGAYPVDQHAMNQVARAEREAAEQELNGLVDEIAKKSGDLVHKVQSAWLEFAEADANFRAGDYPQATIYPVLYHSAFKSLASDRLNQLKKWFEQENWEDE